MSSQILTWTVDCGGGPSHVTVPHTWNQHMPVQWEGPAVYRTRLAVPATPSWLVFRGVSYEAKVLVDGELTFIHRGIWDAFAVPLERWAGRQVEVAVEVVKNGGSTFPVKEVLSGFLPYVFQTFGGIFGEVELAVGEEPNLEPPAPPTRVRVEGTRVFVDDQPFYMRAALTWGWYPELGHPNPPEPVVRREVELARRMGFNTFKFCLWTPPHRFLEVLHEYGMFAWLELPLWDPSDEPAKLRQMGDEMLRISRQYAKHSNIVAWTIGCELSAATPAEYREALVEQVKAITGCPLVKDNSGSAEMYGGDLREFGTFYDFHPYCDTPFYPCTIDSLLIGSRKPMPIFLGEFNDYDVHRNLNEIAREMPYWASDDPSVNPQGVRWQFDLPRLVLETRFCQDGQDEVNQKLAERSHGKATYIRRKVFEHVRAQPDLAGYAVTGWRHTPISTSGMVDDKLEPVFRDGDVLLWNAPAMLFQIPTRFPGWVREGNRPAWRDTQVFFAGQVFLKLGGHSETPLAGMIEWSIRSIEGRQMGTGRSEVGLEACRPSELLDISVDLPSGEYILEASLGELRLERELWVVPAPDWGSRPDWGLVDPHHVFPRLRSGGGFLKGGPNLVCTVLNDEVIQAASDGARVVFVALSDGAKPSPFWRECVLDYPCSASSHTEAVVQAYKDRWSRLYAVSPDAVLDEDYLARRTGSRFTTSVLRVDTRTYREDPILASAQIGRGVLVATTLRPFGQLGTQPAQLTHNPSGSHLLSLLMGL